MQYQALSRYSAKVDVWVVNESLCARWPMLSGVGVVAVTMQYVRCVVLVGVVRVAMRRNRVVSAGLARASSVGV